MITCTSHIRVRYADTDQMRIVHHAKFFEYFEIARSDLLRSVGMGYGDVEKNGFYLPVIEAQARFKSPAYYDELITVDTVIREKPSVKMKIEYRVSRNGAELATGYTIHGFIDGKSGRPVRSPEFFNRLIQRFYIDA
jgi:acyl-CoA thioester hydrolase